MSTGVAALGAVFFAITGTGHVAAYLSAAQWTVLATVALLAAAFAVAFWLPKRARETAEPAAVSQAEPSEPAMAA